MFAMRLMKLISRLEYHKYPRYCGLQERRQFICFLLTTIVELIYVPANLLGLNDYHRSFFFDVYNWIHLFFVVGLQVLFWRNKFSTRTSLYIFFIAITLKLSLESLYQAFAYGVESAHVLGNFNIILIIAAVAISIKMDRLAIIITVMLTCGLVICCIIGNNHYVVRAMRVFFVGYALIIFVLFFNNKTLGLGLRQPHEVDQEEQRALQMLININEREREKALSLIDRLSPEQKEKLRKNVQDHFRDKEFEEMMYRELCPDLTKSEIEICKLILQGKSVKEICDALDKNVTNITSQRSHIRKKLHMDKNEELRSTLEIRMYEIRERLMQDKKKA